MTGPAEDDICEWEETDRYPVVICHAIATECRMEDIFLCAAHAAEWDRERQAQEVIVMPDTFPVVHYVVEVAFQDEAKALYGVFEYEDTAQAFARAYLDHISVSGAEVVPVNLVTIR